MHGQQNIKKCVYSFIYTNQYTKYSKLQINYLREFCYMFRRLIDMLRETLMQRRKK